MISIISINRNCLDWMQLLVASIRKFTSMSHETIIIDNDSEDGSAEWLKKQKDIKATMLNTNVGHGRGLDMALIQATRPFCLVMDIDAHLMCREWEFDFLESYKSHPKRKLIAAKGGEVKPIHPCVMFFERSFFLRNRLKFTADKVHDVGRRIYYDLTENGFDVGFLTPGYESGNKKFYDGAFGDIYYFRGKPTAYHNWYSSRMYKKSQVDNLTCEDYNKYKKIVFNHPFVKDILS